LSIIVTDVHSRRAPTVPVVFEIRPVTADTLGDLAELFETNKTTTGCWCMFFISPHKEVQAGWWGGGNRAAFEEMARASTVPVGLLAYDQDGVPVAWAAVGPRSRFQRAIGPRNTMLRDRDPREDDDVWFVPCFFVRVGHRRSGATRALLDAAVELAAQHGATAVEGFPLAADNPTKLDGYYGRQRVFADTGFECIATPTPKRVVMRRNLRG
jgi:GNAT superfamily N-acetyltransferase